MRLFYFSKKKKLFTLLFFVLTIIVGNIVGSNALIHTPNSSLDVLMIPVKVEGAPQSPHFAYNGQKLVFKAIARHEPEIVRYSWSIDNISWNSSIGKEFEYLVDHTGEHIIHCKIEDVDGNTGYNYTSFNVFEPNRAPIAYISDILNEEVYFIDQPLGLDASKSLDPDENCGDSIIEYRWDLDGDYDYNDGYNGPTLNNITLAPFELRDNFGWLEDSIQVVGLEVEDTKGNLDSYIYQINVGRSIPVAVFSAKNESTIPDLEVQFDASNSYHTNPSRNIISYQWDFDNNGVFDDASGQAPVWSWPLDGLYPVNLNITDDLGVSDIYTKVINVTSEPKFPVAIISSPLNNSLIPFGEDIFLDASQSYDPDEWQLGDSIVSYEWDIDNDHNPDYLFQSGSVSWAELQGHGWDEDMEVNISLIIRDSAGLLANCTFLLKISKNAPIARIIPYSGIAYAHEKIKIDASASYHPNPSRIITNYKWDLDGDNIFEKTSSSSDILIPFDTSEIAPIVKLRVYDSQGDFGECEAPIQFILENRAPITYEIKTNAGNETDIATTSNQDDDLLIVDFVDYDIPFGDEIVSYEWDLDDDGAFDDYIGGNNLTHSDFIDLITAVEGHTYPIHVKITDKAGLSDIAHLEYTVESLDDSNDSSAEDSESSISAFPLIYIGLMSIFAVNMKLIKNLKERKKKAEI